MCHLSPVFPDIPCKAGGFHLSQVLGPEGSVSCHWSHSEWSVRSGRVIRFCSLTQVRQSSHFPQATAGSALWGGWGGSPGRGLVTVGMG